MSASAEESSSRAWKNIDLKCRANRKQTGIGDKGIELILEKQLQPVMRVASFHQHADFWEIHGEVQKIRLEQQIGRRQTQAERNLSNLIVMKQFDVAIELLFFGTKSLDVFDDGG